MRSEWVRLEYAQAHTPPWSVELRNWNIFKTVLFSFEGFAMKDQQAKMRSRTK